MCAEHRFDSFVIPRMLPVPVVVWSQISLLDSEVGQPDHLCTVDRNRIMLAEAN